MDYAIQTSGLTKYYGKARGIIDINLEVAKGEFFGFIGPNGAGKSTTIRSLLGLIFPTSGQASILGLNVKTELKAIKQRIGFVPSEVNFYSGMTVMELLEYSAAFYKGDGKERIGSLAELLSLDLTRKIEDLSLGNRRKAAICQSLLHDPELLIMDEPTSGLDPLIQKRFFDLLIEENKKGKTIFLSSHTLSDVQKLCSRVAIIKEGRIIKLEDVKSLRQSHFKKISLELSPGVSMEPPALEGISAFTAGDNGVSFLYSGDMNPLIKFLGQWDVSNLSVRDPELEEIFINYYNTERGEE